MGRPVSFVLRVDGGGQGALHGQIEHVASGAVAHFGDLEQAAAFMRGYLAGDPPEAGPPPPQGGAAVDSHFAFLRRGPAGPMPAEGPAAATNLIARAPAHGQANGGPGTIAAVAEHLVRWDNQGAPALLIQPLAHVALRLLGLSLVAFVPGGDPPGAITQTLVRGGQAISTSFSSLSAFRAAFTAAAGGRDLLSIPPLLLGEAQATRAFQLGRLSFTPPIELRGGDRFELRFSAPSFPPASPAQIHLRALIGC